MPETRAAVTSAILSGVIRYNFLVNHYIFGVTLCI